MTAVDNTGNVLYHFLRTLSVKVSRSTVQGLLDTPVGNSMRGISDALDALHVKNEVYQLPPTAEYFSQLEAPFITIRQVDRNPFCVVTKNAGSIVDFHDLEGEKRTMPIDKFLKHWSGNTLFAKVTPETPVEPFCFWKDGLFYVLKYKVIIVLLLLIALGLSSAFRHNASSVVIAYLCTLAFGILVSVAILYKELFNERFMERFCHIGKVVDCNEVIHSKGASIAGIGLGELSLLYFSVQFFYTVICPKDFYILATVCSLVPLVFTIYSVAYQLFILHKGCMLCMLVNMAVWCSSALTYCLFAALPNTFRFSSLYVFAALSCIFLISIIIFSDYSKKSKSEYLLKERFSFILTQNAFQSLLKLESGLTLQQNPTEFTINNGLQGSNQLVIITNPNCSNCAHIHSYVKELSIHVPVSLLLITFPNDKDGELISATIITAYLQYGWNTAFNLLSEWFKTHKIQEKNQCKPTSEAERIRKAQLLYCWKQKIVQTPLILINGRKLPKVYSISNLRYVLT